MYMCVHIYSTKNQRREAWQPWNCRPLIRNDFFPLPSDDTSWVLHASACVNDISEQRLPWHVNWVRSLCYPTCSGNEILVQIIHEVSRVSRQETPTHMPKLVDLRSAMVSSQVVLNGELCQRVESSAVHQICPLEFCSCILCKCATVAVHEHFHGRQPANQTTSPPCTNVCNYKRGWRHLPLRLAQGKNAKQVSKKKI